MAWATIGGFEENLQKQHIYRLKNCEHIMQNV